MLQVLIALVYSLIEHSWIVASITAKYFLVAVILNSYRESRGLENVAEDLVNYSNEFIASVIVLGALRGLTGISIEPSFKLFSEAVALGYLGYLFWKY